MRPPARGSVGEGRVVTAPARFLGGSVPAGSRVRPLSLALLHCALACADGFTEI